MEHDFLPLAQVGESWPDPKSCSSSVELSKEISDETTLLFVGVSYIIGSLLS